jgi:ribosomal protein S13
MEIKGISTTLAKKISALLGISGKTLFRELSPHKENKLKKEISIYRKKTKPFKIERKVEQGEGETRTKGYLMLEEKETGEQKGYGEGMQHTPIITSLEEYKKEKIKILINLNT